MSRGRSTAISCGLCVRRARTNLVAQGASPRGSVALTALSQAAAYVSGRDFVIPEDVQDIYADCIAHRLIPDGTGKTRRNLTGGCARRYPEFG